MYRCSVELSISYDGQSEREPANLIDEHARLIMWQTGSICVLNTRYEQWISSCGSPDKLTRSVLFGNAFRLSHHSCSILFLKKSCPMELSVRYG